MSSRYRVSEGRLFEQQTGGDSYAAELMKNVFREVSLKTKNTRCPVVEARSKPLHLEGKFHELREKQAESHCQTTIHFEKSSQVLQQSRWRLLTQL